MDAELRGLWNRAENLAGAWFAEALASHSDRLDLGPLLREKREREMAEFAALVAEHLADVVWPENRVQFTDYDVGKAHAAGTLAGVATGWRSPRTPENPE